MNHQKAQAAIASDPSFCRECGGWLGRKPGTKPYCSLPDCPGSRAPTPGTAEKPMGRASTGRATFASLSRDDDEEKAIRSSVEPPPARRISSSPAVVTTTPVHARRHSAEAEDEWAGEEEEAPVFVLPSLSFIATAAASAALAVGWSYYAFVLSGDDTRRTYGLSTAQFLDLLGTGTGLLLASPVLAWIGRFPVVIEINRVFFMPLLGNVFMLLNILALLILILEPLIPQPDGSEVELALCLDVAGGWKLKYDKERVVGGPCYSFAAAYVRAAS